LESSRGALSYGIFRGKLHFLNYSQKTSVLENFTSEASILEFKIFKKFTKISE
jgi:hypothetical protein